MGAPSPNEELEYLKSLVSQLNDKIKSLEQKALKAVRPTPAEQLRLILIGPPGAGTSRRASSFDMNSFSSVLTIYWTW